MCVLQLLFFFSYHWFSILGLFNFPVDTGISLSIYVVSSFSLLKLMRNFCLHSTSLGLHAWERIAYFLNHLLFFFLLLMTTKDIPLVPVWATHQKAWGVILVQPFLESSHDHGIQPYFSLCDHKEKNRKSRQYCRISTKPQLEKQKSSG